MPMEVETKLRIPDERIRDRILKDEEVLALAMEPFRPIQMDAIYYDTPKRALSEKKWTLRLRKENEESIMVFKQMGRMEGALFQREEYSCPADTVEVGIEGLLALGAPTELRDMGPYVECCRVQFVRNACALRLEDGSVCELALDAGQIQVEKKSEKLLEMEMELLSGDPEEMIKLNHRLKERHDLLPEFYSKYARALLMLRTR